MIRVSAIAHRYGRVLYKVAAEKELSRGKDKSNRQMEENAFDVILAQLQEFVNLLQENLELKKCFLNPLIQRQELVSLIDTLCKKMKFSDHLINFLKVVALQKRLTEIGEILEAYKGEIAQERKQVIAKIVTSHELSAAYQKKLLTILEKKTAKSIKLEIDLDPTLMGGMVIHMESVVIDASLKTRLTKIQHILERVA